MEFSFAYLVFSFNWGDLQNKEKTQSDGNDMQVRAEQQKKIKCLILIAFLSLNGSIKGFKSCIVWYLRPIYFLAKT